jgi:hypothetical protein
MQSILRLLLQLQTVAGMKRTAIDYFHLGMNGQSVKDMGAD